jgi:predicted amidohydrolase
MAKVRVALVQFDAVPEQVEANRRKMQSLAEHAAAAGARWVMFHEGTVCDYTPQLARFAEAVPDGPSTAFVAGLARRLNVMISFGLSEREGERFYITQVFVGPAGLIHAYRKTWIWREGDDGGYRNEWIRYDPGTGPAPFEIDGVRATCFICADGESPRCIERARSLRPQVVFFPNNRADLPGHDVFGARAKAIGAPTLVTNRTGQSWIHDCKGGSVIYSRDGEILAKSNREGREDVLVYDLEL